MLVSHRYRFIFLKTKKTASTTTEIFFEPFCLPENFNYTEEQNRPSIVTEAGIIGSRGKVQDEYYNHMPAKEILQKLGKEIFYGYKKIANVRNPFDMLVSRYHFRAPQISFEEFILNTTGKDFDKMLHSIFLDSEVAADYIIRYENLAEDIETVCRKLNLPFDKNRIGQYKADFRKERKPYTEYYSAKTKAIVQNVFETYMKQFGYQF